MGLLPSRSFRPGCIAWPPTPAWTRPSVVRAVPNRSIPCRSPHVTRRPRPTILQRGTPSARGGARAAARHAAASRPQRAALVFRDVLGWSAPETTEVLDSTVAAVKSALQRARKTIDELLPADLTSAADPADRELLARYVTAFVTDDMDGLVRLLRADALLKMPPQPDLFGGLEIARFFHDTIARGDPLAHPAHRDLGQRPPRGHDPARGRGRA